MKKIWLVLSTITSEIALLIIINVRRYMYDTQCMYYIQLLVSRVTNIMLIAYFNDMTRSNKNRNVHVLNVGLKIENLGCWFTQYNLQLCYSQEREIVFENEAGKGRGWGFGERATPNLIYSKYEAMIGRGDYRILHHFLNLDLSVFPQF